MAIRSGLSRRTLLTGGAGALLSACAVAPPTNVPSAPTAPLLPPIPSPSPSPSPPPATLDQLLAGRFVVAHRGSGDNWPEHTLQAYVNATRTGADAIEISVRATADGVLVCHHDADTQRVTGVAGAVAEATFAQLRERPVDARRWLGGATPLEPISRLDDVLAALPPDCLIFIEDKDGTNTFPLLDLMDDQPRATERFVWKQWAFAKQVEAARRRGYRSWGFLTSDTLGRVDEAVGRHEALGVPVSATDAEIARLVESGSPVMAWEVHTRSERARLHSLGVAGLMCSNVPYVLEEVAPASSDSFARGLRPPGDLPANYASGWASQPPLPRGAGALILQGEGSPRYLLGSMCPLGVEHYQLSFTVEWGSPPQGAHPRAGIAFGLGDDGPYHPRQANATASYQAFLTADGRVALAYQAAGWLASENLATLERSAGGATEIRVTVTEQKVSLATEGRSASVNHMDARGGYLWLWGEQLEGGARFSDVRVTAL